MPKMHKRSLISLLNESRTEFKGDFQVTSSRNNKDMYNVEISESLSCKCEFFAKESSPCKHIIWVMLFVLGAEESSPVLHQLFLTKNELKKILKGSFQNVNSTQQVSVEITSIEKKRTPKSVLLSTSSYPKPSLASGPAVSEIQNYLHDLTSQNHKMIPIEFFTDKEIYLNVMVVARKL